VCSSLKGFWCISCVLIFHMISCPESWQALLGLSMSPGVHVKICLFVDVLSLWKGVDNMLIEQLSFN
jgi:hypothetical protein